MASTQQALALYFGDLTYDQLSAILQIQTNGQRYRYQSFKIANIGQFYTNQPISPINLQQALAFNNTLNLLILTNGELHYSLNGSQWYLLAAGDINCTFKPAGFCPAQVQEFFAKQSLQMQPPTKITIQPDGLILHLGTISNQWLKQNLQTKRFANNPFYCSLMNGWLAWSSKTASTITELQTIHLDPALTTILDITIKPDGQIKADLKNAHYEQTFILLPAGNLVSLKTIDPNLFSYCKTFFKRYSQMAYEVQTLFRPGLPWPTINIIEVERQFQNPWEQSENNGQHF